ncbi:MAG TPA: AsmA family protein [Terriglobales bacterium]
MRHTLRIAGIIATIFCIVLVVIYFSVDANSFRPTIESNLSAALGRSVQVGKLKLSILSGSLGAGNITIADDPAFSTSPFITARYFRVGVELLPLILHKQLKVNTITLKAPDINLYRAPDGKWNFSSLGGAKARAHSGQNAALPQNLSIAKFQVIDGKLTIRRAASDPAAASGSVKTYEKVNILVTNFSTVSQFPFELTASLRGGDVALAGKIGPFNSSDAARTPFDISLKATHMVIHDFDVMARSGIDGLADFDGALTYTGSQAKAVGLFTGTGLKFADKATPSKFPLTIKHVVNVDVDKNEGTISVGDIAVGGAKASLTGSFRIGDPPVLDLKLSGHAMSVDDLASLLASMGVVLAPGAKANGSALSTDLTITGPVNKPVVSGPFQLSNIIGLLGFFSPDTGVAGEANYDGAMTYTGNQMRLAGTITASKMKFTAKASPSPVPLTFKHAVDFDLDKKTGAISQGDLAIGNARATLLGTFSSEKAKSLDLKLNGRTMPVDDLQAMLPAFDIKLPPPYRLSGGTLTTALSIAGPPEALVVKGPIQFSQTRVVGLNLQQKLGSLSMFASKATSSPDTMVQNASCDGRSGPDGIRADKINLVLPALGTVTGQGTVSPKGALNFQLLADLRGGMAGSVSSMAKAGSGKKGIPFAIAGTTSNPEVKADTSSIAGSVAQGAIMAPASALTSFFSKKKPH